MRPAVFNKSCAVGCVALLSLVIFSCKEEAVDQQPVTASGSIVPLKVGNRWIYRTTELDSTGSVLSTSADTLLIVSETLLGSETWYIDNSGITQTNRKDGRWIFSGSPYLTERYPARLNESYVIMDSAVGITARVRSVDENVVVPLGSFSAYTYRWARTSNAEAVGDFSFSPNTGLIKSETYTRSSHGVYVSTRKELIARSLH